MAFTNYTDLKATVADYLARSDLTTQIPDFIQLAENRLRRDLRIRQMLKFVTTTMTAGDGTVALPSDFLAMRDLHLETTPISTIEYQSPSNFFRNARVTDSGKPTIYTVLATEFNFAPKPDSAYVLHMLYYAAPTFLSSTIPSNAFLANCPDLLLYAALGEAEPYLMNDERLQTWASLYDRGLISLSSSDESGEFASSPLSISIATR
jgi:hypothetical protein